jgi:branched-chain amino acid transport system permease protein
MPASRFTQTGNYRTSYPQDESVFATHAEMASLLVLIGVLLVLPWIVPGSMMFTIDTILVYCIAVLGLNITTGYTGLINVGQAAFLGVGAYTAAVVTTMLGFPFYLAIPVAGVMAAIVGAIVGLPSLRLKHLYLAIATLAFQKIFEWSVGKSIFLQQGQAISLPKPVIFGLEIGFRQHNYFWYYVTLFFLIVLALAWRNLMRSRYGRSFVAVRDNDRAADAMGINPGMTKVVAFVVGSFYAGIAGALFAYLYRAAQVEDYTLAISIKFLAMSIVGGLGSLPGSFMGATFLQFLDDGATRLGAFLSDVLPKVAGVDIGSAMRPTTFGLVIVLFLIFEPRGLANFWRLLRTYFKLWPFKY